MIPKSVYGALNETWPMLFLFVTMISIIRLFSLRSRREKIVYYKEFISLFFILYLLLLFELVTNTDMTSYGNNFTFFKEITRHEFGSSLFIRNVIGNVLLFIPFGMYVSFNIKKCSFLKMFFISLIGSSSIELIQLKIGRSFDVDDIILNIFGAIIGFYLYKIIIQIKKKIPKFLKIDLILNIIAIITTIVLILLFIDYVGLMEIF